MAFVWSNENMMEMEMEMQHRGSICGALRRKKIDQIQGSMAMEGYQRWSFEKNEGGVEIELPWMEYIGLWSYEQEFKCK